MYERLAWDPTNITRRNPPEDDVVQRNLCRNFKHALKGDASVGTGLFGSFFKAIAKLENAFKKRPVFTIMLMVKSGKNSGKIRDFFFCESTLLRSVTSGTSRDFGKNDDEKNRVLFLYLRVEPKATFVD